MHPTAVTALRPTRRDFGATLDAIYAGIQRDRRPLPAHDCDGTNYRRWAGAVVAAEVRHANEDFWHLAASYPGLFDRHDRPDTSAAYRLPHEIAAAKAANILGHLIGHEDAIRKAVVMLRSQRKAAADMGQSEKYRSGWARAAEDTTTDLRTALARRRIVWGLLLKAVADYRAARSTMIAMREAA